MNNALPARTPRGAVVLARRWCMVVHVQLLAQADNPRRSTSRTQPATKRKKGNKGKKGVAVAAAKAPSSDSASMQGVDRAQEATGP
jgi:hypothetical protein